MFSINKVGAIYYIAKGIKWLYKNITDIIVYSIYAPLIIVLTFINRPRYISRVNRILFIPEFDRHGGTRTYFETLLGFLKSQRWEVIVAIERERIDENILKLCESLRVRIVPIDGIPRWIRERRRARYMNIIYDVLVVTRQINQFKPDCIVASIGTPGDYLGALLLPYRMIYILHTVPSEGLDPPLALLVKYALSSKKKILTVSKYAENKILQIWFHKRIKMSHVNYIHNATVAPKKLDYDGQFPVKTVLTMGHLVEYKNPKLWLRIAREVIRTLKRGTVRFVWLGQGPLYNDCIEYLTEAEKDSIIFFGYCANPQKYLCEAKVYFQPSLIESHGLAVVEAMSYGVPCVVSRIGGLPESVSDGQNGYIVDLNNENDIITKIIKLLEDDELRLEMGECSREIFQKCFSIEEWYRKMKVEFDLLCKIE